MPVGEMCQVSCEPMDEAVLRSSSVTSLWRMLRRLYSTRQNRQMLHESIACVNDQYNPRYRCDSEADVHPGCGCPT
jgi:hypothetical protein